MTGPYKKGKFGHTHMRVHIRGGGRETQYKYEGSHLSGRERNYFLTELIRKQLANIKIWELQISETAHF